MLIFQHRIHRADLRANPSVLYVFGDNEIRCGMGGQAGEMRGEPNAIGVATLAAPGDYWTEADAQRQCAVIDQDMARLFSALNVGGAVVFPIDGIGSGLARLEEASPTTWVHLQTRIQQLKALGGH